MYRFVSSTLLTCLLLGVGSLADAARAQSSAPRIAVIAHGTAPDAGLSLVELQRLYAGEVTTYGPLSIQQELSDRFFTALLGKSDSAVRRLWVKLLLSGKVSQGLVGFRTDAAVIEFVRDNPGAIGFIDASNVTGDVQLVPIDGTLPGDPAYPLAR